MSSNPPAPLPTSEVIRGYLLDVAGFGFVAATIYVGIFHGTGVPEFATFAALAGTYLGIKAP
jgi:hypothetical protein